MTRALIFGVTGQDGSYLADHLLGLGYEVYGTHRRTSLDNTVRTDKARQSKRFHLLRADLTDPGIPNATCATVGVSPVPIAHTGS